MKVLKIIGQGNEFVYVYFYENDRKLAEIENRKVWECKIGYTINDVKSRILEQGKTARSSSPIIGLIIQTDRGVILESMIHKALYESRINKTESSGDEWFMTTPDIVEQYYLTNVSSPKQLLSNVPFLIHNSAELGICVKQIRKTLKMTHDLVVGGNRQLVSRTEQGKNISIENLFLIIDNLGYNLALVPK